MQCVKGDKVISKRNSLFSTVIIFVLRCKSKKYDIFHEQFQIIRALQINLLATGSAKTNPTNPPHPLSFYFLVSVFKTEVKMVLICVSLSRLLSSAVPVCPLVILMSQSLHLSGRRRGQQHLGISCRDML